MEKTIVTIPVKVKYLSDYIEDLPHNCILDKGKVGAGGTQVAITNMENYIIAVPFLSLIENKVKQHKNLFGVHGKTKVKDIKSYLESDAHPKKIMVTYDSLCKLTPYVNTKDFRLLIDEYHLLFTNYSFRHEAVKCVLNNFNLYKSYTFMTATLLEEDFVLSELKHIPIVEYQWQNVQEVTIHALKCEKSVVPTVLNIINQHLENKIEGDAHFFVNSVEFIEEIIKFLKLNSENTRIIYSQYNKHKVSLPNSKTTDEVKKINFYTSSCFEGVDIYSPEGRIYVVSDKSKSHTLVDISTSMQQICGRIRKTIYATDIMHIYTTTRYNIDISYEEYKEHIKEDISKSKQMVDTLNNLDDFIKSKISLKQESYVSQRNELYIFDDNLVKIDLYNFKVTKHLYRLRINLLNEYDKSGYKSNNNAPENLKALMKEDFKITDKFKEVVQECKKGDSDYLLWAFKQYDFLHEAIKYLGYDKIEEMEYNKIRIKRSLTLFSHKSVSDKIRMQLSTYSDISMGQFISHDRLKAIFYQIYKELNLPKAPKSVDIQEYYKTKSAKKTIKGKTLNGFIIL